MKYYKVTKKFLSGVLEGLTITEKTSVKFVIGKKYSSCVGSSKYVIIDCVEVV